MNLKGRENEFRNIAIELIRRFQNDVGEVFIIYNVFLSMNYIVNFKNPHLIKRITLHEKSEILTENYGKCLSP